MVELFVAWQMVICCRCGAVVVGATVVDGPGRPRATVVVVVEVVEVVLVAAVIAALLQPAAGAGMMSPGWSPWPFRPFKSTVIAT